MTKTSTRFVIALALTMVALAACGRTPGRAIAFAIDVEGIALDRFVTATGWTVTLEEASIALGPIYVYAPDAPPAAVAMRELLLPVARAHGGFDPFGARELRAELLEQRTIDALDVRATPLGTAVGSAGASSDLVIALERPGEGRTLWVAGIAEKDGIAIPFHGGIDFPEEGLARFVEGVPIAAQMDDLGTLVLRVRADRWLDQAHFDRLTEHDGDRFVIGDGDQVALAWRLGARHPSSYAARWIPEGAQ